MKKYTHCNGGYVSLIVLLIVVAGMIYYMAQTVVRNKESQQEALERAASGETYNVNEPVRREDALGRTIDISVQSQERARLINEEIN